MSKRSKKRPYKGDKFRVISLDSEQAAIFLSLIRQAPHDDAQAETALEIIETLEALGTPIGSPEDEDGKSTLNVPYEFPDESLIVVSIGAHTYLPNMFKTLKPNGLILKQYNNIKKAIKNAEVAYDKPLVEAGWERDEGIWFPPESGPVLPEKSDQEPPKEASETESEGEEAPEESPVGVDG